MLAGVFTASEAAAVGVLIALIAGWIGLGRGKRGAKATWSFLRTTFTESVASIAGLFILIIGAYLFSRLLTLSGAAQGFTNSLISLDLDRISLLLVLIVRYIILDMFLESLPMILLTVPLLQPYLETMGIDMIWFGIFMVIMCEIGMVFPPIGLLTFIVHRMAQNPNVNVGHRVPLTAVFKGIMPFTAVAILVVVVLILAHRAPHQARRRIGHTTRLVVIGRGWIGLEVAAAAVERAGVFGQNAAELRAAQAKAVAEYEATRSRVDA